MIIKGSRISKQIVGALAGISMVLASIVPVYAANSKTVYVTKTGSDYHLDGCSELDENAIKTNVDTATSMGYAPCTKCGADSLSSNQPSKSNNSEEVEETNEAVEEGTAGDDSNAEEIVDEVVAEFGPEDEDTTSGDEEEAEETESSSSKSSSSKSSGSKSSTSKSTNSSKVNNSTTSKTSNSTSKSSSKTSTSKSSNSKSSSGSNGSKTLMTEKQRKARFSSKTNPKMGTNPANQPARAASSGFLYADFGTYNNYASKNGLGGTPIYLLGTIMDIQPVSELNGQYSLAIMVNDCDGYQWYMRCNCAKDKYDLLKNEIYGKAANIYGTYAGYSGVTNRPMMDVSMIMEIGGTNVMINLYQ